MIATTKNGLWGAKKHVLICEKSWAIFSHFWLRLKNGLSSKEINLTRRRKMFSKKLSFVLLLYNVDWEAILRRWFIYLPWEELPFLWLLRPSLSVRGKKFGGNICQVILRIDQRKNADQDQDVIRNSWLTIV